DAPHDGQRATGLRALHGAAGRHVHPLPPAGARRRRRSGSPRRGVLRPHPVRAVRAPDPAHPGRAARVLRHAMTTSTDPVELLERAIAYTWGCLSNVDEHRLATPTPCARWDLAHLLDHMADSLDAFLEASSGVVTLVPATSSGCPLENTG